MDAEEKEFRDWLFRNRHILSKYSSDEVANFAKLNGFTKDVICRVLCSFNDALGGWNTDRRAKAAVKHFETTLGLLSPERDLTRLWQNVYHYQTDGNEGEEV